MTGAEVLAKLENRINIAWYLTPTEYDILVASINDDGTSGPSAGVLVDVDGDGDPDIIITPIPEED